MGSLKRAESGNLMFLETAEQASGCMSEASPH